LTQPYADEHLNTIYALLFCDDLELYRSSTADADDYPWKDLFAPAASSEALKKICNDPELESRVRLLATNELRQRGVVDDTRHIYGVVVEVSLPDGLDVLAVYEDGTVRYINYSGKVVIWEAETAESKALKDDLFAAARNVVSQIGPWDGDRLPAPVVGNARLNFLVSDGPYFGEAPFEALASDPMGGAVLNSAGEFMRFLIKNAAD
jgi:hypothetical protein